MGTPEMVEANAAACSREEPLSQDERAQVLAALEETKRLSELYCTGCNYCMPCPTGVNIPRNFEIMNWHRVYGLTEPARRWYSWLRTEGDKNLNAAACTGCGQCEGKCPQKIPIRKQLEETAAAFGVISPPAPRPPTLTAWCILRGLWRPARRGAGGGAQGTAEARLPTRRHLLDREATRGRTVRLGFDGYR